MRKVTITIRTADRQPFPNYVGSTVRSLVVSGVDPADLHLVLTDPDRRWLEAEVGDLPVQVHTPRARRSPNANALAQIAVLDSAPADWLLMLEDDLDVCADFAGSVERWLQRHAVPEVHVYRFCAFGHSRQVTAESAQYPLLEQRGSQAIALRSAEAYDCAAWALTKGDRWRPRQAPFQDEPSRGFDKLVGYWALDRWPTDPPVGLVSIPHFAHHIGTNSGLHQSTVVNTASFAGRDWQYPAS